MGAPLKLTNAWEPVCEVLNEGQNPLFGSISHAPVYLILASFDAMKWHEACSGFDGGGWGLLLAGPKGLPPGELLSVPFWPLLPFLLLEFDELDFGVWAGSFAFLEPLLEGDFDLSPPLLFPLLLLVLLPLSSSSHYQQRARI